MAISYIGADVDSKMTNLAVERNGKIVLEVCVPTTIPSLVAVLESIPRPRKLAFEEGPMAHWLARNLKPFVDELVVCDPRRNALINKDGDSDDRIDSQKLTVLLRGDFLRSVYHSDNDRHVLLKQWVGLYSDRVKDAVRQINKIRARCWQHGIRPVRGALRNVAARQAWLESLGAHCVADQLKMLFLGFDAVGGQVEMSRRKMVSLAKPYDIIKYWQELPGVGPIRAITLYAYLDTPWRFGNNPHKLCKYCGVGLQRSSSGKDRKGRMKVGDLQLAWQVNRRLKCAVMGAAVSAVRQGKNVFAKQYERLVRDGLTAGNALHTVARKILTVMWGMWKTGTRFDSRLV
jgi:transposase